MDDLDFSAFSTDVEEEEGEALDFSAESEDVPEAEIDGGIVGNTHSSPEKPRPDHLLSSPSFKHDKGEVKQVDGKWYVRLKRDGSIVSLDEDDPQFGAPTTDKNVLSAFGKTKPTKAAEREIAKQAIATDPGAWADLEAGWYNLRKTIETAKFVGAEEALPAAREGRGVGGFAGLKLPPEMLERASEEGLSGIAEFAGKEGAVPTGASVDRFNKSQTWEEAWEAFAADPLTVTRSTVLRSAPSSMPSVVGGIVGMVGGPPVAAAGAGAGSYVVELGNAIGEGLAEHGADLNNPESVKAAWAKHGPEIMRKANVRSVIIGAADALSGGIGGKIVEKPAKSLIESGLKLAGGTGVQVAGGAGGEAAAQLATEGEITSPAAVLGEAIGEVGMGAVETAGQAVVGAVRGRKGDREDIGGEPDPGDDLPDFPGEDVEEPVSRGAERPPVGKAPMAPRRPTETAKNIPQNIPDDEFDQALKSGLQSKFRNFLEMEARAKAGDRGSQEDLYDAEQALIEDFRIAGLPGDKIGKMQPINSIEDIRRAFNAASNEERSAYWMSGKMPDSTEQEPDSTLSDFSAESRDVGTRAVPQRAEDGDIEAARAQVESEPSEAQAAAGNYRKGHVTLHGLNVTIETPKGGVRSGAAPDGKAWSVEMPADYGYFKRSEGKDGDQVDVYLGGDRASTKAFIVDQIDPKTGRLDEHKVILAVRDRATAEAIYDASFSDGSGSKRRKTVTETTVDGIKAWLKDGDTIRPFAIQKDFHGTAPRNEVPARVSDLAPDQAAVSKPKKQAVSVLRRSGDKDLPGVGGELPGVSGGSGAATAEGNDARPEEQRQRVRAGQHALGDVANPIDQSAQSTIRETRREKDDRRPSIKKARPEKQSGELAAASGHVRGQGPDTGQDSTLAEEGKEQPRPVRVTPDREKAAETQPEPGDEGIDPDEYAAFKKSAEEYFKPTPEEAKKELTKHFERMNRLLQRKDLSASQRGELESAIAEVEKEIADLKASPDKEKPEPEAAPTAPPEMKFSINLGGNRVGEFTIKAEPEEAAPAEEQAAATEETEAGEQTVLPGAERISEREEAQRKSDEKLKPKAEQKPMESGLFGDERNQTDIFDKPTPSKSRAAPAPRIEDFGEKIEGARKDAVGQAAEALAEDVDIAAEPLSKIFPQPDYTKLAEAGVSPEALAYVAIFRDEIPAKPRKGYKVKRWVEQVKVLRDFSQKLLAGTVEPREIDQEIRGKIPMLLKLIYTRQMIAGIDPQHLEFAAKWRMTVARVSMWKGKPVQPAADRFVIDDHNGRWTDIEGETIEDVRQNAHAAIIAAAKKEAGKAAGERRTPINVYSDRFTKEVFLGFKGLTGVIRLKAGFPSIKDARAYLAENAADLQKQIDEMREGPDLRRAANMPRIGPQRREGDVTPEKFQEAFGFRGVQFGNYVEDDRRQSDLNEAFDALMDLADILKVPSQALSLNGQLGLAFGARGHGGKRAAAAHFEADKVVINLTKHAGPGSLAHEWLHALDNYFAKQDIGAERPVRTYISEAKRSGGKSRVAIFEAWKAIEKAVSRGPYHKRAVELDEARSKPYWSTTIEEAARAFERYVVDRLADQQNANDFLANLNLESGAYPTAEGMQGQGIREAFDNLFRTIEVRMEGDRAVLASIARPVATITGNELMDFKGPEDMPALRRAAVNWYDKNLRGTTVATKDGRLVRFTRKGMGKTTSTSKGDILLRSVPAIRAIIENGDVVFSEAGKKPGIIERFVISAPVNFAGGTRQLAVSIHRTPDGNYQYDFTFDRDATGNETPRSRGGPVGLASLEMPRLVAGDLNLFEMGRNFKAGRESPYRFIITPKQRAQITSGILSLSQRFLGHRVRLKVIDDLAAEGYPEFVGSYDPNDRTIAVAIRTSLDPLETFSHETIHAMRDIGLFAEAEWAVLSKWAKDVHLPRTDIRDKYEDRYRKRFDITEDQLQELLIEEAIADAFGRYATGKLHAPAGVRAIIARVARFLEAVRNMLAGRGFRTAADVFADIYAGNLADRDFNLSQRGFELYMRQGMKDGRRLVVARRMPDGTIKYGDWGDAHYDLVDFETEGDPLYNIVGDFGFAIPGGEFMTREQAEEWVRKNEPEVWKKLDADEGTMLESSDYSAADYKAYIAKGTLANLQNPSPITGDPYDVAPTEEAREGLQNVAMNINLDYLAAPADIKQVIADVSEQSAHFIGARRGVITNVQTRELAADLGMTVEDLKKRQHGAAFNAENIFAARVLLVKSATRVRELAAKAKKSEKLADLAEFQKAFTRHVAIQEQVAGLAAEAGRALQQFKMMAGDNFYKGAKELVDIARSKNPDDPFGSRNKFGKDAVLDLAEMVDALDDPAAINRFSRDTFRVTIGNMIREAWINALLSGLRTHTTNILSNTLTALWQVPETAIAATIGAMHGGEKVQMAEASARLVGLIEGAQEGLRAGATAFRTGEPSDLGTKIETHRIKAIPGIAGEIIRIPSRALLAEDEVFKAVNYRAELNAQAVRIAMSEGRRGASLAARIEELKNAPTQAMKTAAHKAALYNTFQSELGPIGRAVMQMRDRIPGAWIVLPFIRTPANIIKYAAERSPFGLLMQEVRDNIRGKNGNVARDTQLARIFLGTSIGVSIAMMAGAGLISGGGPDDPKERNLLRMRGWQPYSIRIGDTWYSYQRLDPFGFMMGVSADLVELGEAVTDAEADKVGAMIVTSISGNLLEKTWLRGLGDLLQAVQDPERYGEYYIRGLSGTLIPTGIAQVAQTNDPVLRDARSIVDVLKSRIPGMSSGLLPRRNIFGEEIRREGALGPDLVSPIFTSTEKQDKVIDAMVELRYAPSMPRREINGHQLTPEQYDDYAEMAGKAAKKELDRKVGLKSWDNKDPDEKTKVIKSAFDDAREDARKRMKRKYPELRKKAD